MLEAAPPPRPMSTPPPTDDGVAPAGNAICSALADITDRSASTIGLQAAHFARGFEFERGGSRAMLGRPNRLLKAGADRPFEHDRKRAGDAVSLAVRLPRARCVRQPQVRTPRNR